MSLLNRNDSIALVSNSNGLDLSMIDKITELEYILKQLNLQTITSKSLFKDDNNKTFSAEIRAKELMKFYNDNDIKAIFDLSGGDLCNEVLRYLDFSKIKNSNKPFFGYSDLTVILNSLYSKTNKVNYNYQLRNLIREDGENQIKNFTNTILLNKDNSLFDFDYKWIQGKSMEGIVVGGNIRCMLKLAGTEYLPNFENKILFLEALSGDENKISTFIEQYIQIGAFNNLKGLILGHFTEYEGSNSNPPIEELILGKLNNDKLPVIKTNELGHSPNSKAIAIGCNIQLFS